MTQQPNASSIEYENARAKAQAMSDEDLFRMTYILGNAGFASEDFSHPAVELCLEKNSVLLARELYRSGVAYAPFAQAYFDESTTREELPKDVRDSIIANFDQPSASAESEQDKDASQLVPAFMRRKYSPIVLAICLPLMLILYMLEPLGAWNRLALLLLVVCSLWGTLMMVRGVEPIERKTEPG